MPDFLDEVRLDVDAFVDELTRTGAQVLEMTAKSAFGNCLYQTDVGLANPGLIEPDLFGRICQRAQAAGLEVVAYVNVLLDDVLGRKQTDWLQKDIAGQPLLFESYPMFCMNSPYREQIIALVAEIVSRFPVDGVMPDIQYWHAGGCFCPSCRERFEAEAGYRLDPAAFGRSQWMDLAAFRRRVRRELITAIQAAGEAQRPGRLWTWNGSGNFSDDPQMDALLGAAGTEAHPPAYDLCSAKAHWMLSCGRPFELWMPESIGSWGHHTLTTEATLRGMAALALANGGAVTTNHVAPPCGDYGGHVLPPVYELISGLMSWVQEREHLCQGTRSLSEVAVLHSVAGVQYANAHRAMKAGTPPDSPDVFPDWAQGPGNSTTCATLLDQAQVPFDFLCGERALDNLDHYRVLILPNVGPMDDAAADCIRAFARQGGRVVATYATSLLDEHGAVRDNFALADLFGIDFGHWADDSLVYVDRCQDDIAQGLPAMPLLVKDAGYQQHPKHRAAFCHLHNEAQPLARLTEPILESDWAAGRHIYHDHAPPGERTDRPAVIHNRYGGGDCLFLPVPILQAFAHQPNPWLRQLLINCIQLGTEDGPGSAVQVNGPSWLRTIAMEDDDGWSVHLVRLQQETGTMFLEEGPSGVTIDGLCRPPFRVDNVIDGVTGHGLSWETTDDGVAWTVGGVDCHTIVRLLKA